MEAEKRNISLELINEVATYLALRPYREVAGLLAALNREVTQAQCAVPNGTVKVEPGAAEQEPELVR